MARISTNMSASADKQLVQLIQEGQIPLIAHGQALDLGTGEGHDAVFLIQKGFDVIGIDLDPAAVKTTRENVSGHGLFGFFQVGDIRQIPVEDSWVDFTNDSGCFCTLSPEDQVIAAVEIARVTKRRGLLLLKTAPGQNILSLFEPHFKLENQVDASLLMRKR